MDAYGVRSVHLVSEQSLSGAGEKGIQRDSPYRKSAEMNVLPYIEGEEEKVVKETNKILGKLAHGGIRDAGIKLGVTCTRVFVEDIHTEVIYVDTKKPNTVEGLKKTLSAFRGGLRGLGFHQPQRGQSSSWMTPRCLSLSCMPDMVEQSRYRPH